MSAPLTLGMFRELLSTYHAAGRVRFDRFDVVPTTIQSRYESNLPALGWAVRGVRYPSVGEVIAEIDRALARFTYDSLLLIDQPGEMTYLTGVLEEYGNVYLLTMRDPL